MFRNCVILLVLLLATVSQGAFAGGRNGYSSRYTTTYGTWDRNFNSYYSYTETTTYSNCGYYTCYENYSRTSNVYVEETIIESGGYSGYTKVTVYDNSRYEPNGRYVSYYTHNGTVVHREFYRPHRYINNHYYYYDGRYDYRTVNYVVLDDVTAQIVLGMEFVAVGAHVLSHCDGDDTACIILGLASSVSGSASMISASRREAKRTELQRQIEANQKSAEDSDLEDSYAGEQ